VHVHVGRVRQQVHRARGVEQDQHVRLLDLLLDDVQRIHPGRRAGGHRPRRDRACNYDDPPARVSRHGRTGVREAPAAKRRPQCVRSYNWTRRAPDNPLFLDRRVYDGPDGALTGAHVRRQKTFPGR
jgi:hypothetical protein